MHRIALLTLVALAAVACSPSFTAPVGRFTTPIANSLGQVCWTEVDTSGAPTLRTATFRADATYDPSSLLTLTDRVRVRIHGRSTEPADRCTQRDEATDVPLSDTIELERETSQPVVVGGEAYGADLAELVNDGRFWIGASAAGNVGVGDERLTFENGRITVGF